MPGHETKVRLLAGLGRLLAESGVLVNVVSTPEIYLYEWVTFMRTRNDVHQVLSTRNLR